MPTRGCIHKLLFFVYISKKKGARGSGHDDALWRWSATALIASCLQERTQCAEPAGQCLVCTWHLTARQTDELQRQCGCNLWL